MLFDQLVERSGGPAFAAAQFVAAAVAGDAQQPGGEVAAAVAVERPPGGDHRILRGILGGGRRAQHAQAEPEDAPLVAPHEQIERVKLAAARAFGECVVAELFGRAI